MMELMVKMVEAIKFSSSSFGSGLFFESFADGKIHSWWSWCFFNKLVQYPFYQHLALLAVTQQLDVQHQTLKFPQKTSSSGFCLLKIFLLIGSNLSSIIDPILCHIVVNLCLHALCKVTSSKNIFLYVARRRAIIAGNLSIKVRP